MFDRVYNTAIRESFNIGSLLLLIERSQLRWFGHLSRMPQEQLLKQTLCTKVNGKRVVGRSRIRRFYYAEDLGWNPLKLRPSKMQSVLVVWKEWRVNLELLPSQPSRKSW